ncbi:MAG: hypothetical protein IID32_12010 [Planctomycetes bacterium]|nr:hypothetical protein [Planctomycetota bacterium]
MSPQPTRLSDRAVLPDPVPALFRFDRIPEAGIAPPQYDKRWFKREGEKSIYVSGILHHKLIVSGIVTLFMSFNVTDSAESNNEHVLIMKSARMAKKAMGLFDALFSRTDISVAEEARAANVHLKEKREQKREKRRGRVSEAAEKEASKR